MKAAEEHEERRVTVTIYGIRNCDTMKKAFTWLDQRGIDYTFHDYKKTGVDADILKLAISHHGWENVINRKGTTWRGLPEHVRDAMNASCALAAAMKNPSLVRRPLLVKDSTIHLGFDAETYASIFTGLRK